MDEAVGALQGVRSSANHSAVPEVVMVLQSPDLTQHIQQQQQQQHQDNYNSEPEA